MAIEVEIEKAFKDFYFKVAFQSDSSTMGILGASGSGKSMTLRCIAGIETPDRGRIVINGKTVYDSEKGINQKPQERRIGYLFQNYALFPAMTVEQNIGCGFRGKKAEQRERVQNFIERYHLKGLEHHLPSQLSGGQQQRAALARMMIGEPEMILLDEPFSALDSYLKDVVQRDMQEFLKEYTGDFLLVTHSRDEAFKFCQDLTLLKEGKTLIFGKTRDLFLQPQLVEAARLTGCKNYSRIERMDVHHVYALDWGLSLKTELPVQKDMTHVAVRGHWMRPAEQEGENCFRVEVAECIETTFEHQYRVRNAGGKDTQPLWWMRPKDSFMQDGREGIPRYLFLPPEHLMLLKE